MTRGAAELGRRDRRAGQPGARRAVGSLRPAESVRRSTRDAGRPGPDLFTLVLAYVEKSPCADGNWVGSKQYTHACYSDVIPLWGAERLDVGNVPYRDNGVEYPVLVGGFMWLSADLTRAMHTCSPRSARASCSASSPACCWRSAALFTAAGTVGAAGRRPYDAAIFALSPLVVMHAFSNWDLLAMAFASCGLWAWARGRPVAAGVLIGLGTAAKLYPVFLLLPIVLAGDPHPALPRGELVRGQRGGRLAHGQHAARARVLRGLAGVLRLQLRPRRRGQHVLVHGPLPGHGRLQRRATPRPGRRPGSRSRSCCSVRWRRSPGWRCWLRSSRGSASWRSCRCSRSC